MIRKLIAGMLAALSLVLLLGGSAGADVYIDQEKPADWEERDLLRITALNLFENDAFVLECGGQSMLIDGGVKPREKDLADYLEAHNLSHLDILFNTHPHDDHLEAMFYGVKWGRISGDIFISPFRENYNNQYQKWMVKALKEKEIPYRQILNGEELELGGARMLLYRYNPGTRKTDGGSMSVNDMAGVLWIRFGDTAILLTSDIGGTIQSMLAQQYGAEGLKAEIMTAPHHGKNTVNPDLLDAAAPSLVLITGRVVRTEECRKQLERRSIEWKRTSYGNITMETDGKDWYVNQEDTYGELKKLREQKEKQEKKKKK